MPPFPHDQVASARSGNAAAPRRAPAPRPAPLAMVRDASDVADEAATFGDRLSDQVAAIGGSWAFIIAFALVLFGWMMLNSDVLAQLGQAFDPYPYIFLNLMLSTLAAIQAPVIMMSQNRQAAKARLAARLDYEVNLRTEQALQQLHVRIDTAIGARLDELLSLARADAARRERMP